MQHRHLSIGAIVLAVAALVACGGGGSGVTNPSLSGTVAVGAPLPGAAVTLRDANGKELTTTADANGAYTFTDVSGLVAPIMVKATGTAGGTNYTLYSLASTVSTQQGATGVVNVTPATDSVVSQALGSQTPETVFKDPAKIKAVDATKLSEAKTKLNDALKNVLTALGHDPAKVDLITTRFEANNTGLDKLLDLVQLQTVANGTGTDIRVADKSTGAAVTISSTNTSSVTPLATTKALIDLNTASIRNLIADFNKLTGSKADLQSAAMKDLFDSEFLSEGKTRDDMLKQFWTSATDNFVGGKFLDYVIGACYSQAATAATTAAYVCEGLATAQDPDGSQNQFSLPVRQGADGKWRAYGDRSLFQFDLKPVVQASYGVSNGSKTLISLKTGINLWIPKSTGISSAVLYASKDDGTTWTESMKLTLKSSCNNDFLSIDDGTSDCSNFKSVSDADANTANTYMDQGQRKFKIVGKTASGDKTFVGKFNRQLFTAVTGQSAIDRSGLGITLTELGTSSVTLLGFPNDVSAHIISGTNASGDTSWEGAALAKLKGKATVSAANASCKQNAGTACDTAFNTSTGKITSLSVNGRDANGRGIWLNYAQ